MTEQSRFCTVHNRVRLTITSTLHALHTHWRHEEKDWDRERKMWHACPLILIQTSAAGPKLSFGLYIQGCCSVKPQKIAHAGNVIQLIMALHAAAL